MVGDPPAGKIDYSVFAFPKGPTMPVEKRQADGRETREKAKVKALVFARDRNLCRAFGVSPICQKLAWDRHELKPVGRGGQVTTANAVAICRADHRACQNALGGRRLEFTWPGKATGKAPDADAPGAVRAVWLGTRADIRKTGSRA